VCMNARPEICTPRAGTPASPSTLTMLSSWLATQPSDGGASVPLAT
jgi:hypothetical protein